MAPNEPPSIKILALGMPRTGTGSVKLALEQLGHRPVHHGLDVIHRPRESAIWNDLLRKKHFKQQNLSRTDLDHLFHGYAAVTDMCFCLWDDLLDAYPEAKLILVQRDLEAWYHSFNNVLMRDLFTFKSKVFKHIVEPFLGTHFVRMGEMMMLSFFNAASKTEFDANARDRYLQYYSDVRAAAKQRGQAVLEFKLGDGWAPLCGFLGTEVPKVNFPRANEEATILRFWAEVEKRMWVRVGVVVGCYVSPLLFLAAIAVLYLQLR